MSPAGAVGWVGQGLLVAALVAACLAFLEAGGAVLRGRAAGARPPPAWLGWAWPAAAVLAFLALAWLAGRFLLGDLSLAYVFYYTRTDLEWPWRLAGTWAGREGSFLLWSAALAATSAVAARGRWVRDEADRAFHAWMRLALAAALVVFLGAAVAQDTFAPTASNLLSGRPGGNGLNPTLRSAYILIHPPMMFVAYALATVPAAAALAHFVTGSQAWSRAALAPSRVAWMLFTAAMGLGSLWAYYTLGFGGYWAWDPVEVANLLPWLALTAYLHSQVLHLRHGRHGIGGPMLAILPLALSLFSTISTRSGLWVSVHAFTDPTDSFDPDAAARFLAILDVEPSLRTYVALLGALLAGSLALWSMRTAADTGRARTAALVAAALLGALAGAFAVDPQQTLGLLFDLAAAIVLDDVAYGLLALAFGATLLAAVPALVRSDSAQASPRLRIDLRSLAAYSSATLALGVLVLFLFHMAAVNGWNPAFYEARFPLLAAPVALGLVVLLALPFGRRTAILLAGATALLAALAALQWRAAPQGPALGVMALAATLVGLERVRRAARPAGMPRRHQASAALLAVAGLADLAFAVSPPAAVGLGAFGLPGPTWHPAWPMQAALGALALVALGAGVRALLGLRVPGWAYVLAALLVGYGVAPLAAAAAWWLRPRDPLPHEASAVAGPAPASVRARLRQVAIYGAHVAFALALVGYAPSTYAKQQAELELGEAPVAFAHHELSLVPTGALGPAGREATSLGPTLEVRRAGATHGLPAPLDWEPQAGSHMPRPGTLRHADGDLYIQVEAVHVAAGSPCAPAQGLWVEAYAGVPQRPCTGAVIDGARVTATWLPGVGLLWAALLLMVASMALLLAADARPRRPAAPAVVA